MTNIKDYVLNKIETTDINTYPLNDEFIWDSANLLYGTMFGGSALIIKKITELIEQVFIEKMLNKNNVNNEQLSLVLLWKAQPTLFKVIPDINKHACAILHILS